MLYNFDLLAETEPPVNVAAGAATRIDRELDWDLAFQESITVVSASPFFQLPVDIVVNEQSSARALTRRAGDGSGICAAAAFDAATSTVRVAARMIDIALLRDHTVST